MFKVKGELFLLKLKTQGYTNTLHVHLTRQLNQAPRAWLRATLPRVPVWTGTAKGTLAPLARSLDVAVPISPLVQRPGRSPEIGETHGSFELSAKKFTYTFKYRNTLPYFFLNEFFRASVKLNLKTPTPWFAIRAGRVAFINYVRNITFKNTPSIKKFLKVKTLKIG